MSGGSLEYISWRIDETAGKVREWIRAHAGEPRKKRGRNPLAPPEQDSEIWEYDWKPHPYYAKKYAGRPFVKSANALRMGTLARLEKAARILDLAARLAHEAEWMFSDDTGPETFCAMFDKLVKMHKAGERLSGDVGEVPEDD